jgi:hypothetical protein
MRLEDFRTAFKSTTLLPMMNVALRETINTGSIFYDFGK